MDAVWHRYGASDARPERQGLGLDAGRDESDAELPDDPSPSCVRSRSGRPDRRGSAGHVASLAARTGLVARQDVDDVVARSAFRDGIYRGSRPCWRTGVSGERATRRLQPAERPFLVGSDQARISRHIDLRARSRGTACDRSAAWLRPRLIEEATAGLELLL